MNKCVKLVISKNSFTMAPAFTTFLLHIEIILVSLAPLNPTALAW
jgi:hypothetical protein